MCVLRTTFDSDVSTYFLGLLMVDDATAAGLEKNIVFIPQWNLFHRWYLA